MLKTELQRAMDAHNEQDPNTLYLKSWIQSENSDPDLHSSEKLDPDPHLSDVDPQPCFKFLNAILCEFP
jgi:hypothetical protein